MPLKILAICISCDKSEIDDFKKYTQHILEKEPSITWYHISVEKDSSKEDISDEEGYSLLNRLKTLETNSIFIETENPYSYLDQLLMKNNHVHAIVYSSHSGGSYIGREANPLLSTMKFAQLVEKAFRNKSCLKFIYFDSCNMACVQYIACFAESTKYIVGCPNYYDWTSILELDSFHKMKEGNLDELINIIEEFTEYFNNTNALVEIGIYDPYYARLLWNSFVDHEDMLHITKESNIDTEIYDLCKIVHSSELPKKCLQYFEELFKKTIIYRKRCSKCAETVSESYIGIALLEYAK